MAIANPTILIMMTTYNGEEFLIQQIESICQQSYSNWQLVVRDDGSSDQTLAILNAYAEKDARIQVVQNQTDYHGAYPNFWGLVAYCKQLKAYDYYMFADQDDVWDKDKLEVYMDFCSDKGLNEPLLVYGDMRIIDGDGQVTSNSLEANLGIAYTNAISTFFAHKVHGCNSFFNRCLFELALPLSPEEPEAKYVSHDNYYTKFAALLGQVYYLPRPMMSYRRYGTNVTSQHAYDFKLKRILKRLTALEELAKDHALTYRQTRATLERMKLLPLADGQMKLLKTVETILDRGGIYAIKQISKHHIDWGKRVKNVSRSLVLCLGMYKKYMT
ncbi:MAG: glycosyltransferase family 2 protein [Catonella sp.]|jgi:putative glycosyltransferase|uniref:glycosyltransferase family 2 protein n=1 Tax=Abiotrophia TaxID=46123 RepID=UPI000F1BDBD7|nr:glycosyltransferase family 2 protein [Abiotrophia sp.]MBF0941984.1 glycosyltransferase family 2 protein [Abiotrophia sp.]RKW16830.1 MAG: glycosyltransferase family 2 protein [Catonella sp.]